MWSDKYDAFLICFNVKNYLALVFHLKIFTWEGPMEPCRWQWSYSWQYKDKDEYAKSVVKDAQIMAWILGSIVSPIESETFDL